MTPDSLYCDGGLAGPKNPSPIGGSWAFCWVSKEWSRFKWRSGFVEPADIGIEGITNNLTELLAAVFALESVPAGWSGTLWTDSIITFHRLGISKRFENVPGWLVERVLVLREHPRRFNVKYLSGHPTREELAKGFSNRNGWPVSEHNVWCDKLCRQATERFLKLRKAENSAK